MLRNCNSQGVAATAFSAKYIPPPVRRGSMKTYPPEVRQQKRRLVLAPTLTASFPVPSDATSPNDFNCRLLPFIKITRFAPRLSASSPTAPLPRSVYEYAASDPRRQTLNNASRKRSGVGRTSKPGTLFSFLLRILPAMILISHPTCTKP